jgi:hypothetical protein
MNSFLSGWRLSCEADLKQGQAGARSNNVTSNVERFFNQPLKKKDGGVKQFQTWRLR